MSENSMPDEKTPEVRSPSETLIYCLEEFGDAEPSRAIVVWVDGTDLCWSASGPYNYTHMIGMLECAKAKIMEKFLA
jgi:hypothetical protein